MSKIVDRIRKLLDLSKHNNSPEEAAQAAAHAQDLMFKYQIGEADLETTEERTQEDLVTETVGTEAKTKRSVWKACLAHALAKSMGCEMWNNRAEERPRFEVYGLKSSVQTVGYMFGYLSLEVDRMCAAAWKAHGHEMRQSAHTWKNSYRMGAVNEIRKRLEEQRKEQVQHVVEVVQSQRAATGTTTTALALYQTDQERVATGYQQERKKKGIRAGRASSYRCNPSAYERGSVAGQSVSLGGGRGLPASPSRIRG